MDYKVSPLKIFGDIRFWIILCFVARLYAITNPPLEVGHNWRQTDGLMIARNFYENKADILYPTVDVGGDRTGIVGCEFPILNYLVYILSLVFGYHDWFGRLIVLVSSSIGVLYFYKIVLREFGERPAFNAAILLMFSFWFSYSRKNIPDVFAVSLCLVALYHSIRFLEDGVWWRVVVFFVLAALGCLSKILAATTLTVLAFPMLNASIPIIRKAIVTLIATFILGIVCWWYFIWVPHLNETYGFGEHFFMGLSFQEGAARIMADLPRMLKRFYDTPMKFTGFAAFVFALAWVIRKKDWLALGLFAVPYFSFLIILIKTGTSAVGDTYYMLTMIVPMAFITGYGLSYLNNTRIVNFILLVVAIENIAAQIYDFRIRQPFRSLEALEGIMDGFSNRTDKICISGESTEPTSMYFAHRKGWVATNENMMDPAFTGDIKQRGCKYVVIVRKRYGDVTLNYPVVHDSEYFKVYKLD
ncbi:MAG: glycosyltransferase family 39 protein [Chryseolinea sp.]